MRRFLVILVALACICMLVGACASQGTSTQIPINTNAAFPPAKIRIGLEASFPPFAVITTDKQGPSGFSVELVKAIAARTGLDVEFADVGEDQVLSAVLNCEYDAGISADTITDKLRQQMTFSDPYLTVGHVVVVKKGNITITGRDQLSGMTVGVENGSSSAIEIQSIPGAHASTYPTSDLAFQDLIAGYIDAVIASKPRALNYVGIPANKLKIVGDEFGSESYAIAICNQRADLPQKINDGLAAAKADGTLDKLTQKWLKNLVVR